MNNYETDDYDGLLSDDNNQKIDVVVRKISKVVKIVWVIILLITFLPFLLIVFFSWKMPQGNRHGCTEQVIATIVDNNAKVDYIKNPSVHKSNENKSMYYECRVYTPVYMYTFKGKSYEVKSHFSSSNSYFGIGDKIKIYINPNSPEKLYSPVERRKSFLIDCRLLAIPLFYLVFTAVSVYKLKHGGKEILILLLQKIIK